MRTTGSKAKKSSKTPAQAASIDERFVVVPVAMLPQSVARMRGTASGRISEIHFQDGTIRISGGALAKRFFDWCEENHGPDESCRKHAKPGKKRSAAEVEASRHTPRVHSALLWVSNPDLLVNGKC